MRQAYRKMMDKVSPSGELVEAAVRGRPAERRPRMGRRMIAAAAAVALCLAIPALGARVEPIYRLMYLVSPSVAQFFVPVERSCVSSGVEMELVAARLEGDTAQFYITLEGDGLDGTVDLYDSYRILTPFDSTGTCELVGWEDGTATFLVTIATMDGSRIPGGKITFQVRELLTGQPFPAKGPAQGITKHRAVVPHAASARRLPIIDPGLSLFIDPDVTALKIPVALTHGNRI